MAKVFRRGDIDLGIRSNFMLALNEISVQQIFSALYANTDLKKEPMSGGDKWAHFMSNYIDEKGDFMTQPKNIIFG